MKVFLNASHTSSMEEMKSIRNILLILAAIVVFVVLKELAGLLIPLVLAALLTILNLPLVNFLEDRKIPRFLVFPVVAVLTIAVLFLVITMISGTVETLIDKQEILARQFMAKVNLAIEWAGVTVPGVSVDSVREEVYKVVSPSRITAMLGTVLGSLGSFGSSTVLFLVYYLILLSGATGYKEYVKYVSGDKGGNRQGLSVWENTQQSISAYIAIKTLMSLLTGLIAGIICWAFGLEFALFWGFMAFLLNYIPSIGSIAATILPILMAIVQFDSVGRIVALGILLGVTQFTVGSVLDPMVMGSRLRLNTVTVIFGLLFWGYIWGVPGMLLSVPLLVMMRLILERSEDLSVLARVMGYPERPRKRPSILSRFLKKTVDLKDSEQQGEEILPTLDE